MLHAELDQAGGSAGLRLLSVASCCLDRASLDVESELETAEVARAAGTGRRAHVECQGLREPS